MGLTIIQLHVHVLSLSTDTVTYLDSHFYTCLLDFLKHAARTFLFGSIKDQEHRGNGSTEIIKQ